MVRMISGRLVLVAACLVMFASGLAAQNRVAVIGLQRSVGETQEIKKAQAELEAKYKPRQAEIDKLGKEIEGLQAQLQQGQNKLTPQAAQDLQLQGQRKQRDLQRLTEDVN